MYSDGPTTGSAAEAGEDRSLVAKAREGDRIAFDRLVIKYRDRVVGLCARLLCSPVEGEDAAQETFLKVYRNLDRFRGDAEFFTWLYRIALNTCRNRRRSWWNRLRRIAVRLDEPIQTENGPQPRELGDTRMIPTKDLERKRLGAAIREGLTGLAAKHRELVVLRDVQGLSYEEIERLTGLSSGTVKSRLSRAREALSHKLKGIADER
mgnify:FL=1